MLSSLGAISPPLKPQELMIEVIGLFWVFFLSIFKLKFIFMQFFVYKL